MLVAVMIAILLLLNAFFAFAEMALISARKTKLTQLADEGVLGAKVALEELENPEQFISTVQVGLTFIGLLLGVFGESGVAEASEAWMVSLGWSPTFAKLSGSVMVVLSIGLLSMLLGELIPKRVALLNPERYACMVAPWMRVARKVVGPLVGGLTAISNGVFKLFGVKEPEVVPVSDAEINVLMAQGLEAGVFEEAEPGMVSNVLSLADKRVGDVMTPKSDMLWIDSSLSIEEIAEKLTACPYSRVPVAERELSNAIGFLHAKDLWSCLQDRDEEFVERLIKKTREPFFVPKSTALLSMLEQFQSQQVHVALVADEYGEIVGMVTLNDVLGEVVGDVPVEEGQVGEGYERRADGSWLVDGGLSSQKLKDLLGVSSFPKEDVAGFATVGGLAMAMLEKMPRPSDHFQVDGYRFEVLDIDGLRVDKMLITPIRPPALPDGDGGE